MDGHASIAVQLDSLVVQLSPRSAEHGGLVDAMERDLNRTPPAASALSPAPAQSPTRSPRASPGPSRRGSSASVGAYGGSPRGRTASPLLSDEFRDTQVSPTSPRSGVLGSKAQERGTQLASGGLGQMPQKPLTFEAFHRRYAGSPTGGNLEGTPDGDTFSLVDEADAASRAAKSRPAATRGYTMPVSGTVVGVQRPNSTLHHITRVTTSASFLDAEIHRTSFLVLQDERKLAQAAHRDAAGLPPPATKERSTVTSTSLSEQHHPTLHHHDGEELRPSMQKLKLRGAILAQQLDGISVWEREQSQSNTEEKIRADVTAEFRRARDAREVASGRVRATTAAAALGDSPARPVAADSSMALTPGGGSPGSRLEEVSARLSPSPTSGSPTRSISGGSPARGGWAGGSPGQMGSPSRGGVLAGRSVVARGEKPGPQEKIHLRPDPSEDDFDDLRNRREQARDEHKTRLQNLLMEVR